jgi:hypothetical protein
VHLIAALPSLHLARASPLLRRHLFSWPAHPHRCTALSYLAGVAVPPYHILADASNRRASIAYLGWHIRSPILAGASRCRAALSYFGRRIAVPPYLILAGASNRRASIAYLG